MNEKENEERFNRRMERAGRIMSLAVMVAGVVIRVLGVLNLTGFDLLAPNEDTKTD